MNLAPPTPGADMDKVDEDEKRAEGAVHEIDEISVEHGQGEANDEDKENELTEEEKAVMKEVDVDQIDVEIEDFLKSTELKD